jgi:Mrp family chromosome partitioning ATPase
MQKPSGPARIVAFCSPKAGVGRSMAVANVAWVLATAGRRVLVVDWDLESPSLHAFFRPFLLDPMLASTEGVIDAANGFARQPSHPSADAGQILLGCAVSLEWTFPGGGTLDFLPAGRQSPAYPVRVADFDWRAFLDAPAGDSFVDGVERSLRAEYDVVLIDIHCGLNEAGRMCAVRLADAVVLCFTLVPSSIEGARNLAEQVQSERSRTPAEFFPVPMRIDFAEKELLERGRRHARESFAPFQPASLPRRESYWAEVEVAYIPYYAYSEALAPFGDRPGDANSMLAASERLASRLVAAPIGSVVYATPEKTKQVLAKYEGHGWK